MGTQEIKCSVQTCKYNDKNFTCTLKNITVGSLTNNNLASNKTETECASFVLDA